MRSRVVRFLVALVGYSAAHWRAGRWRRALFWDALLVLSVALIFHLPIWVFLVLHLGQAIDAAVLEEKDEHSDGAYALSATVALAVLGLIFVGARAQWVEAFRIPAGSMIPALQIGDHMFVAKSAPTPGRGDVIVFRYPLEPDKDFVKRVVAVGGDTVEIRDDQIFINGKPVPRKHVDAPCEYQDYDAIEQKWEPRDCDAWDETLDGHTFRVLFDRNGSPHSTPPRTVPPGRYFVLGDNRDNSHDSRYWGFVPPENLKGTARRIWWSTGPDGIRWDRVDTPIR